MPLSPGFVIAAVVGTVLYFGAVKVAHGVKTVARETKHVFVHGAKHKHVPQSK